MHPFNFVELCKDRGILMNDVGDPPPVPSKLHQHFPILNAEFIFVPASGNTRTRKINEIKALRTALGGCGLKLAKDFVEGSVKLSGKFQDAATLSSWLINTNRILRSETFGTEYAYQLAITSMTEDQVYL